MKRDGIPVLRGKQSKFIFIQMKERVNQNRFKVQNIAVKPNRFRLGKGGTISLLCPETEEN